MPQVEHDACWAAPVNVPAVQRVHVEAEASGAAPAAHAVHWLAAVPPCVPRIVPDAQDWQPSLAPGTSWYLPTAQLKQDVLELPAAEYVPVGQGVHTPVR